MEGNYCVSMIHVFETYHQLFNKKNERVVSVVARLVGFVEDKSAVWNVRGLRCHTHG